MGLLLLLYLILLGLDVLRHGYYIEHLGNRIHHPSETAVAGLVYVFSTLWLRSMLSMPWLHIGGALVLLLGLRLLVHDTGLLLYRELPLTYLSPDADARTERLLHRLRAMGISPMAARIAFFTFTLLIFIACVSS